MLRVMKALFDGCGIVKTGRGWEMRFETKKGMGWEDKAKLLASSQQEASDISAVPA